MLVLLLLVTTATTTTHSFVLQPSVSSSRRWSRIPQSLPSLLSLSMTTTSDTDDDDDDDDWFADFDPTEFDTRANQGNRDNGRERSSSTSTSNRNYYTRDVSRDQSPIDEEVVVDLLQQRLEAKQNRDYDTADAIKEQLCNEYSVMVFDQERKWRTGWRSPNSSSSRQKRKPMDFGPTGHDYSISPNAGTMTGSIDITDVDELLAKRLQAKITRNFDIADQLEEDLAAVGVYVHDKQKLWRGDGVPFGNSRNTRDEYTKSQHSLLADGIPDVLIMALITERSKYKSQRDFAKADAIREGLLSNYNIFIDDRLCQWSVGGDFGTERNAQREASAALKNSDYELSTASADLDNDSDMELIQSKVNDRMQAKMDRNFDIADTIRADLLERYNVIINDKLRQWSVGGHFLNATTGRIMKPRGVYTQRPSSVASDSTTIDVATIAQLLKERSQLKEYRKYDEADDIQAQLYDTYGVLVNDQGKEWWIENTSDHYIQALDPTNSDTNVFSSNDVQVIEQKLKQRSESRTNGDYETADAIRDFLRETYSVIILDKYKEWMRVQDDNNADATTTTTMHLQEDETVAFQQTQEDRDLANAFESIFEKSNDTFDATTGNHLDSTGEGELPVTDTTVDNELLNAFDSVLDEPNVVVTEEDDSMNLSSLTVVQLKEKLRTAGLPVSGKKAELILRLETNQ